MSVLFDILSGKKDYITLVKEFIEKVFRHEAKKYHCEEDNLSIVISRESNGGMDIMTYSKSDNRILRVIPDKEVQDILIK